MNAGDAIVRFTGRLDPAGFEAALEFVARFAQTRSLSPETATRLHLVIEELITNSMTHGGQGEGEPVELEIEKTTCHLRIGYRDHGSPFTPPATGIARRTNDQEGGFGWLLIRGFCSVIHHEPARPGNRLELTIPVDETGH